MRALLFKILCFFLITNHSSSLNILGIFPLPAKSHSLTTSAIMKSLTSAGHKVVVISPFPLSRPMENFTVIDSSSDSFFYVGRSDIKDLINYDAYSRLKFINAVEEMHCQKLMKMKTIQDLIKNGRFDVVFVEVLTMHQCYTPLVEKLNIPVIGVVSQRSWIYADQAINNHNNPATIPVELMTYWKQYNFWFRLKSVFTYITEKFVWHFHISTRIDNFYNQNGFTSGAASLSLVFINSHPALMPRPMNPNVIEIGGIHMQTEKSLPKTIKQFVDDAEHGVILFSLGSVARSDTMSENALQAFKQAFAEIPQRVIWKFEDNFDVTDNVILSEWVPQRDILAHKNVVAFISHCGQSSVYEAIYTETPIIAVPLFGDQPSNAAVLENLGIAFYLDINSISKSKILEAIRGIIDESYKENMNKFSKLLKDRPFTAEESVIYWTEYVVRYRGATHLQIPELNWFQDLLLDVTAVPIAILIFFYILYAFRF